MKNFLDKATSRLATAQIPIARRHIIRAMEDTRAALRLINDLGGDTMTLFALDEEGHMIGTITDGDIRRALMRGVSVESPISDVMYRDFHRILPEDDRYKIAAEARLKGIDLLPVLDSEGFITEFLDLRLKDAFLPLDAVLMAGGKGERLRPLTLNCPKPLLVVGKSPIIDYNIERLMRVGINNIFVTVNYLREMIEQHFAEPFHGVGIKCVAEPKRLGTFGSLSLVEGLENDNVLVMNSDLLTTLSFEKMFNHHLESGAALTMAVVPYTVSIPFAILQTEGDRVTGLQEKPVYNHFANAGVYILRRDLIGRLPKGEYTDAPDFIGTLIREGLKVAYHPVDGIWVDIGSPADFKHASELMSLAK